MLRTRSQAYDDGRQAKEALAQYNFAGDIGKMLIPAALGLMLAIWNWQANVTLIGLFTLVTACLLWRFIPTQVGTHAAPEKSSQPANGKGMTSGLLALLATGVVDSAVRMGFLTFLPFLLQSKGAGTTGIGAALSLLFVGGAFGKLSCGYLGARIGMMKTVWLTESLTALLIAAAVWMPLIGLMTMLPLLGLALNGTSSVLYGSVPELAAPDKRDHAFALFYTGTIGGGAISPIIFGGLGDVAGIPTAMIMLAAILLLTLPLSQHVQKMLNG